jgi:hypothetical protein
VGAADTRRAGTALTSKGLPGGGFGHPNANRTINGEQYGSASGRWPSNVVWTHTPDCDPDGDCAAGCPVAELDAQAGVRTSGKAAAGGHVRGAGPGVGIYGGGKGLWRDAGSAGELYGDSGGASRFFPVFRYEPKAPSSERPVSGGDGETSAVAANRCRICGRQDLSGSRCECPEPEWLPRGGTDVVQHPTVKPVDLMRWLVRLVTPPGGRVLDCFAGSGTTGEAALLEGFDAVLVEKHAPYLPLIRARLAPYADPTVLARARGRGVTPRRGRRAAAPDLDGDLLSLLEAP